MSFKDFSTAHPSSATDKAAQPGKTPPANDPAQKPAPTADDAPNKK